MPENDCFKNRFTPRKFHTRKSLQSLEKEVRKSVNENNNSWKKINSESVCSDYCVVSLKEPPPTYILPIWIKRFDRRAPTIPQVKLSVLLFLFCGSNYTIRYRD